MPPPRLPPASLVGRQRELADLRRRLAAGERLLTLTGPPGVGKTRLALAVVPVLRRRFPDGVYPVSLAAVSAPALVPAAIGSALGPAAGAALAAAIGDRRLLLVLDNLEHLLRDREVGVGGSLGCRAAVLRACCVRAPRVPLAP